jgi:predicted DNA-binding transcriptional regulator YafY
VRTREALEARHPPVAQASSQEPVRVPLLKGELVDLLKRAASRDLQRQGELPFESDGKIKLVAPSERGATAVACLLLETVRRLGGSRAPAGALKRALEQLLGSLDNQERMSVEVEVYDILQWLGVSLGALEPEPQEPPAQPRAYEEDDHPHKIARIERAIAQEEDLEICYFTGVRAELGWRRVTPHSLEARKYLHAWCHKRQDERVFRISRISRLRAIREAPQERHARHIGPAEDRPQPSSQTPGQGQMSLLGKDP